MRNFVLAILFSISSNLHCQIIGRMTLHNEGAWSMISVNGETPYKTTDGEGNFELKLPKTKNDIFILSSWISIEIKNVPNSKKVNIGEISLPLRKSISVKEYEDLSSKEKELCIPVRHWTELLGYEFKNQLSESCLTFKCGQIKYEICEFKFDIENQKVIIDWKKVKVCEE
ncbi:MULTISPECIES: hypothetical protein [unclassified Flavobacterium]|jgi:hypothetical protein|uniref:hypothetical protein n=1 Tax=unclassified Flavobacterium TaxID=196869 RepID=UPI0025C3CD99|nr:hypothetical protein [Flavobacterium sp. UBA7663]